MVDCKECGNEIDMKKPGFGFKHGELFCSEKCLLEYEKKNNIPSSKGCEFCG